MSANLLVVERVDEPIFGVNDFYRSFDTTMIQREYDVAADHINQINVENIC